MFYLADFKNKWDKKYKSTERYKRSQEMLRESLDPDGVFGEKEYYNYNVARKNNNQAIANQGFSKNSGKELSEWMSLNDTQKDAIRFVENRHIRQRNRAIDRLELQRKNKLPLTATEYIDSLLPYENEWLEKRQYNKSAKKYKEYLERKKNKTKKVEDVVSTSNQKAPKVVTSNPVNQNPEVSKVINPQQSSHKVNEKVKEVITQPKKGLGLGKKALIGTLG